MKNKLCVEAWHLHGGRGDGCAKQEYVTMITRPPPPAAAAAAAWKI